MRSLLTILLSVVVVGAFGETAFTNVRSRGVFIRGERKIYPLLPPLRINKPMEQMQREDALGRSRFSRVLDNEIPQRRDMLKYLTPIKDQGKRGTCAAFASVALVETMVKLKLGREVDLSEQFAYWASKALPGGVYPNSDGSIVFDMLKTIARYGLVSEQDLPYQIRGWFEDTANHPNCVAAFKANPDNVPTECVTNGHGGQAVGSRAVSPIEGVQEVASDPNTLIGFLLAGIPVELSVSVFQKAWGFDNPRSDKFRAGVVTNPNPDDVEVGGHAILVVGYDLGSKTYLFKNSWGTDEWASKGVVPGVGIIPMTYVRKHAFASTAKLANRALPW